MTSQVVKNPPANAGDSRNVGSNPWVGKISWSRKWQPTPVFLLGKFHGQRSLAGYSPRGCRELDMTEHRTQWTMYVCVCVCVCVCEVASVVSDSLGPYGL